MASALAAQLERLKTSAAPSAPQLRGKPSLLFSYQEAADLDVDSVYHLALAGFQDLAARDSRYSAYEQLLFARELLDQSREQNTKEWNDEFSRVIRDFLQLLSNHFLLPSAFKVLEYLIRKFRVHELDVAAVLQCCLPYHSTNEFVRVVEILAIQKSQWDFLARVQANGVALPRENIINRCLTDQALLKFICEAAMTAARPDVLNRTYLSFYTAVVCGTVSKMNKVSEGTVAVLLPHLMAGLQKNVIPDFRAASIMIFSQLAARAPLSLKFLTKVLQQLARGAEPKDVRVVALLLAQISTSQPHLTLLPAKILKAVFKLPDFDQEVATITASPSSAPLMRLLTTSLTVALAHHQSLGPRLVALLHAAPLPLPTAESLVTALLKLGVSATRHSSDSLPSDDDQQAADWPATKQTALKALRVLEQRYPEQVDAAINKLLSAPKPLAGDDDMAVDESEEGSGEEDDNQEGCKAEVFAFVKEAFHGGVHCPVGEDAGEMMSLARAVYAPASSVRVMAVQQMGALLTSPEASASSRAAAEAALLDRLADDHWGVVSAVLDLPALLSLLPERLLPALGAVLKRVESVFGGAKSHSAGTKVFKVLSKLATSDPTPSTSQALALALAYLLTTPTHRALAHSALRELSASAHPLLSKLPHPTAPSTKPHKAEGTPEADAATNSATIKHLANAIATHPNLLPSLPALASATTPAGAHLVLLSLAHLLLRTPAARAPHTTSDTAPTLLSIVSASWPTTTPLPSALADAWASAASSLFSPLCLPTAGHSSSLHGSLPLTHTLAHLVALQAAAKTLAPAPDSDPQLPPAFSTLTHLTPPQAFLPALITLLTPIPLPSLISLLAAQMVPASSTTDTTPSIHCAHLLSHFISTQTCEPPSLPTLLPPLLAALSSPSTPLVSSALSLAQTIANALSSTPSDPASLPASVSTFLTATILPSADILLSNPAALPEIVAPAFISPSDAPSSSKTPKRKPSKTLSKDTPTSLQSFLTTTLHDLSGPSATPIALTLLSILTPSTLPTALLPAALPQLSRILSAAAPLTPTDIHLASSILHLVTPTTLTTCPTALPTLLPLLAPSATIPAALQATALSTITPELYAALPAALQLPALKALLVASSSNPDESCRAAARASLEAAALSASSLEPLLHVELPSQPNPNKAQKTGSKARKLQAPSESDQATSDAVEASLRQAVDVLEMLQWKDPLPTPLQALIIPLQTLISSLLPHMGTITMPHSEGGGDDAVPAGGAALQSACGYAVQLALLAVKRILTGAQEGSKVVGIVDVRLMVECAQRAPDAAVRNSALQVVEVMAGKRPEATLDHVLAVLAIVNQASTVQDDAYSTRIAASTVTAVVPAWLKAGRSVADLWQAVVASIGPVPASKRLALMTTLLEVLPEEAGLPVALLHLLKPSVPAPKTPGSEESIEGGDDWAADLASRLAAQATAGARLQAFARLLELSLEGKAPQAAVPRTVVAFVTAQLKMRSLVTTARKLLVSGEEAALELAYVRAGGEGLMETALSQLQALGASMEGAEEGAASRALYSATSGLYGLIKALEGVLPSPLYIQALVRLQGPGSEDAGRRRALRLLTSKVAAVQQEIEDMAIIAPAKRDDYAAAIEAACMKLLPHHPALLDPSSASPSTRQATLLVLGALLQHFGPSSAPALVPTLPAIISTASSDPSLAVRASALTAMATGVRAIPLQFLPHFPAAFRAIFGSAQSSSDAIAASDASPTDPAPAPTEDADTAPPAESTRVDQQAMLLAASLAAIESFFKHAGKFMSPYVGPAIRLLLRPHLLSSRSAHCAAFASRLREDIPTAVESRLLLEPLFAQLEAAMQAGPEPTVALLDMCAAAITPLKPRFVIQLHDRTFAFLLRALDVRQTHPPEIASAAGGVHAVESAVVRAAVALVMKLSESKFKPLFLRLMEWANTTTVAEPGRTVPSANLGRMCAMVAMVEGLTQRLRSVFVPYYRYLLDTCMHYLTSGADGKPQQRPKKKKKKQQQLEEVEGMEEEGAPGAGVSEVDLETSWVMRGKIVRSLHRCFLYDAAGFLDEDRFKRLLGPLVDQLEAEPPAELVEVVAEQCADEELDRSLLGTVGHGVDGLGRAVVACLVQMGVTAGSDALWKPLNQQALMMTRSGSSRTRMLGLEVCAQLIERLREEFLVLLPETIPFLAELLEDMDVWVEKRAQEVVLLLEELSGEKLDQYMK